MTTLTEHFSNRYLRQPSPQEQLLYEHLLYCVQTEPPSRVMERFCRLFIDGIGYREQQIWLAVEHIISSKQAEKEFPYVINRCCHILINHWQMQPQLRDSIPELVSLLENHYTQELGSSRASKRLQSLLKLFLQTEEYVTLRRLALVINQGTKLSNNDSKPLGSLIHRYPYLYEHCLLSGDSNYEHQQMIRQIKADMQHKLDYDLSQYVTNQVRQAQLSSQVSTSAASRIIKPMNNPTLLSDRDLGFALKKFVGKVEGAYTYHDLAHHFVTHMKQVPTFKILKDDFYQYLTSGINPAYGKRQFNDKLYNHFKKILPDNESQKPNELIFVRTCSQVLNHLVVESKQNPKHFVFVDLLSNLGTTFTTGLLLKIALVCQKVKPYLEKRFAILFNHYESFNRDGVPWLVKALENFNVASSIHFGKADVSCLKYLM